MQNHFVGYKAFLFDLNGTMINDMPYHIKAWHRILTNIGANISLERMKQECYGKNEELIERELEIGHYLVQGYSLYKISEITGLNKKTVSAIKLMIIK